MEVSCTIAQLALTDFRIGRVAFQRSTRYLHCSIDYYTVCDY